jgi:hypothetical protein
MVVARMTEEELKALEKRAIDARAFCWITGSFSNPSKADAVIENDVPALIAEVRRLQAKIVAIFNEAIA